MNRMLLPTVLVAGLIVAEPCAASSVRWQDKPSYPLVCRGGGIISSTLTVTRATDTGRFQFKKGARSAESGLAPVSARGWIAACATASLMLFFSIPTDHQED